MTTLQKMQNSTAVVNTQDAIADSSAQKAKVWFNRNIALLSSTIAIATASVAAAAIAALAIRNILINSNEPITLPPSPPPSPAPSPKPALSYEWKNTTTICDFYRDNKYVLVLTDVYAHCTKQVVGFVNESVNNLLNLDVRDPRYPASNTLTNLQNIAQNTTKSSTNESLNNNGNTKNNSLSDKKTKQPPVKQTDNNLPDPHEEFQDLENIKLNQLDLFKILNEHQITPESSTAGFLTGLVTTLLVDKLASPIFHSQVQPDVDEALSYTIDVFKEALSLFRTLVTPISEEQLTHSNLKSLNEYIKSLLAGATLTLSQRCLLNMLAPKLTNIVEKELAIKNDLTSVEQIAIADLILGQLKASSNPNIRKVFNVIYRQIFAQECMNTPVSLQTITAALTRLMPTVPHVTEIQRRWTVLRATIDTTVFVTTSIISAIIAQRFGQL